MIDPVIVVDYDPGWPGSFQRLAHHLRGGLSGVAERIEHIGSTSVPGLAAKPILDVDVVVASREAVPGAIARLESMGYRHLGDQGIPGREAFQSPTGTPRHHLYVCSCDSGELARHLAFRDCLRADPELRRAYATLKQRLAGQFSHDRPGYTDAKADFVRAALSRWRRTTVAIRPSSPADAEVGVAWADAKRLEYAAYSPVFWRPAPDARLRHRPFLESCLNSSDYTSFTALAGEEPVGVVVANHRVSAPLLRDDSAPAWVIDDFYVAQADLWHSAGVRLLEAEADAARRAHCKQLIVVCGYRDAGKKEFLQYAGLKSDVMWWVKPIHPRRRTEPDPDVSMAVGPAPSVYDPGGLTALALEEPTQVSVFENAAAGAGAVLAIVPVRTGNALLTRELRGSGYAEASEWFVWTW